MKHYGCKKKSKSNVNPLAEELKFKAYSLLSEYCESEMIEAASYLMLASNCIEGYELKKRKLKFIKENS